MTIFQQSLHIPVQHAAAVFQSRICSVSGEEKTYADPIFKNITESFYQSSQLKPCTACVKE